MNALIQGLPDPITTMRISRSNTERIKVVLAILMGWVAMQAQAKDFTPPPPASPLVGELQRQMQIKLKVDKDGSIQEASVEKSTGVKDLDQSTLKFMQKTWKLPSYAGKTVTVPIIFEPYKDIGLSFSPSFKGGHYPCPPYPYLAFKEHASGTIILTVIFDGTGHPTSVKIVRSSGVAILDENTVNFISTNWRAPAISNADTDPRSCTFPVSYSLPK